MRDTVDGRICVDAVFGVNIGSGREEKVPREKPQVPLGLQYKNASGLKAHQYGKIPLQLERPDLTPFTCIFPVLYRQIPGHNNPCS